MPRSLLFALFLLIVSNAFSQRPENSMYMAGGFNIQSSTSDPINYIIDQYNQDRDLTEQMGHINGSSGAAFTFGFGYGEDISFLIFELGLTLGGSGVKTASYLQNNVSQSRDLKISCYWINTGFGFMFQNENKFAYGAGLYVDYGNFRVRTRTYNTNSNKPSFTTIGEPQVILAFTPTIYLDYNFSDLIGVSLRPFYRAQVVENDLRYVDQFLNPNTYAQADQEQMQGVMLSGFGGEVKVIFYF